MLSGSSRHLGSDSGVSGHLRGRGTERRNATVAMGGTGARGVRMRILAGPHGRQSGPTRGERAGLHSGAFDVVLNVDAPWDRCACRGAASSSTRSDLGQWRAHMATELNGDDRAAHDLARAVLDSINASLRGLRDGTVTVVVQDGVVVQVERTEKFRLEKPGRER